MKQTNQKPLKLLLEIPRNARENIVESSRSPQSQKTIDRKTETKTRTKTTTSRQNKTIKHQTKTWICLRTLEKIKNNPQKVP